MLKYTTIIFCTWWLYRSVFLSLWHFGVSVWQTIPFWIGNLGPETHACCCAEAQRAKSSSLCRGEVGEISCVTACCLPEVHNFCCFPSRWCALILFVFFFSPPSSQLRVSVFQSKRSLLAKKGFSLKTLEHILAAGCDRRTWNPLPSPFAGQLGPSPFMAWNFSGLAWSFTGHSPHIRGHNMHLSICHDERAFLQQGSYRVFLPLVVLQMCSDVPHPLLSFRFSGLKGPVRGTFCL